MGKSDEVRRLLDERGVEHRDNDVNMAVRYTRWDNGGKREVRYEEWSNGTTRLDAGNVTPEQAIAATVGNRTDLSKRLREVNGLHEFAELFGFSWADGSDWTWHDVACAMANEIDAATGNRSCASCPEMDNPDSYISHIHAALEWHDEHVPRPTNPRNTCVVLEGEKLPEEVLFIGANGVTHYLPEGEGTLTAEQVLECAKGVYFEGYGDGATHRGHGIEETDWQTIADKLNATLGAGTCNIEKTHGKSPIDGKEIVLYKCSNCGTLIGADSRYCNQCGRRIKEEAE